MSEHPTIRDRHDILALIKRRYGSQLDLARETGLSSSKISAALGSSYPEVERAIAAALGLPVQQLWPDRYWPNGRRRQSNTRPQRARASQNAKPITDEEPHP